MGELGGGPLTQPYPNTTLLDDSMGFSSMGRASRYLSPALALTILSQPSPNHLILQDYDQRDLPS